MERKETIKCSSCPKLYTRTIRAGKGRDVQLKRTECRSCSMSKAMEGSKNPNWKGGHQHWQEGKLGRDRNGLSWKSQQGLCRERDNHTCQDCEKTKEQLGYEPDCDHIVPYRISFSHALDNLKLRCKSCHKKAEALRTELWGGKSFGGHLGKEPKTTCRKCGNHRCVENSVIHASSIASI